MSSFGASCIMGTAMTIADFDALHVPNNGCSITNGTNTWSLSTFTINASPLNAAGYTAAPTTADVQIEFTLFNNGFQVTYTPLGQFAQAVNNGVTGQSLQFDTGFWISVPSGNTGFDKVGTHLLNPVLNIPASPGGIPSIGLTEYVHSSNYPYPIYSSYGIDNSYPSMESAFFNPNSTIAITNTLQMRSGGRAGASATIAGYSNTFDTPEPLSFAMMGAGLVGLAFLRRRKSK